MQVEKVTIGRQVSAPSGDGHITAEFTARVDQGEDPEQVAARLQRLVDHEIHRGHPIALTQERLESLERDASRTAETLARLKADLAMTCDAIERCDGLAELGRKHGLNVEELRALAVPF